MDHELLLISTQFFPIPNCAPPAPQSSAAACILHRMILLHTRNQHRPLYQHRISHLLPFQQLPRFQYHPPKMQQSTKKNQMALDEQFKMCYCNGSKKRWKQNNEYGMTINCCNCCCYCRIQFRVQGSGCQGLVTLNHWHIACSIASRNVFFSRIGRIIIN